MKLGLSDQRKHICQAVQVFTVQFGFNFAFDAPTVWNSLPEDICASPTIASFRKKLKTYLYAKAYPPQLIFSYGFSVVPTYFCPWTLNCILLLSCCALESTTQWRLSAIKVKIEFELELELVRTALLIFTNQQFVFQSYQCEKA